MPEVTLARPTPERLVALAQTVSTSPVDPEGITDHRWLLGDARQVRDRIERSLIHCRSMDGDGWIVAADGRAIGLITVKLRGDEAETFSFVAADWQGRGVATAARAGLLALLRGDPRIRLVVSTARAGSRSAAVSRRLGYDCVGTEIRRHPEHGGDVVLERYELDVSGPDVSP